MRDAVFTLERCAGETIVTIRCMVDRQTGPVLESLTADALEEGPKAIALDLAECPFLDSSGVRALIRIRRRATDAGIAFRLRRCSPAVVSVLYRMHLEGIFALSAIAADALSLSPASRFHRFSFRASVQVWDGLIHRSGETLGLGPEGAVVGIPGPLRLFQVLRLELTLPDTGERFRCMGRVVYRQNDPVGTVAVEFLSLDPALREWLQKQLVS